MKSHTQWIGILNQLYGKAKAETILDVLLARLDAYSIQFTSLEVNSDRLSQRDVMLITYADQVTEPDRAPLASLSSFCVEQLTGLVNCIHILPFYPSTSDDGFSVSDYRLVDPRLGSWQDIERLRLNFRLMFDGVINHISAQSVWFQAFLQNDPVYGDNFIVVNGMPDLSLVVRPRALPLLTRFGEKRVWTTFSSDQVDLNYKDPQVLLEIIDLLLFYVSHGAEFIRLDAIAYLWKEIGTSCIHLPQVHQIIQLFRSILDQTAPFVKLITETNVAHVDNISYFGDGANEAQLVYNFALPPLILHTFYSGDASALMQWADSLRLPSTGRVTFFNFLASHDGIGLNPVRGILSEAAIGAIVERVLSHAGLVSSKQNSDGSLSPYELNINYFDALSNPNGGEPVDLQVERFVAAHAIMLSLVGLPGIYFHSLFGSRGWLEGVLQTAANRTINRQKLTRIELESNMADPTSLRHKVFTRIASLLRARASSPAFDPYGTQKIFDFGREVFAILRASTRADERILCLQNISQNQQTLSRNFVDLFGNSSLVDLFTGQSINIQAVLFLDPYQTRWLRIPG